jgi:drug/metabolite transporter (DMT)-like permease
MRRLIRLYPAAWRERYGDEMAAVLEDRPPGPFDVADLLLGAIDAHLHLRGLGHHSEHRKGIPMSLRLAGIAAVVGGLLWTIFFALGVAAAATNTDLSPAAPLIIIGGIALLVAAAGLSAFQFRDHPRSIWLSFLIPLGGVILFVVSWANLAVDEAFWNLGAIGVLMIFIGAAIYSGVTVRTRALSRPAAMATLVGSALAIPAFLMVGGGLMLGTMGALLLAVGGLIFGLGWIGLGIDAIRRDRIVAPTGPSPA